MNPLASIRESLFMIRPFGIEMAEPSTQGRLLLQGIRRAAYPKCKSRTRLKQAERRWPFTGYCATCFSRSHRELKFFAGFGPEGLAVSLPTGAGPPSGGAITVSLEPQPANVLPASNTRTRAS